MSYGRIARLEFYRTYDSQQELHEPLPLLIVEISQIVEAGEDERVYIVTDLTHSEKKKIRTFIDSTKKPTALSVLRKALECIAK